MRRRLALLLVVAPALLGSGACGIPSDSAPKPIAQENVEDLEGAEAAVPTTVSPGADERIFLVRTIGEDKQLAPFAVDVEEPTPKRLLDALRAARDPQDTTLSNAVPEDLQLDLILDDSTAILSLSEEWDDIQADSQKFAAAQLLFTATELGTVDAVEFRTLEDDEALPVPIDDGTFAERVDRTDYAEIAPPDTPLVP